MTMMTTIFASDFHGTGKVFIDKIQQMRRKYPVAQIVFGGDYIDGRKHSKEVLNYIRQLQNKVHAVALAGNHEDLLMSFWKTHSDWDYVNWRDNGGGSTFKSLTGKRIRYKNAPEMLDQVKLYDGTPLKQWLHDLPLTYVNQDACFVHAGLTINGPVIQTEAVTYEQNHGWFNKTRVTKTVKYDDHYPVEKAIKATNRDTKLWDRQIVEFANITHNYTDHAIVIGHTPTCYFDIHDGGGMFITKYSTVNTFLQKEQCPIIEYHYPDEESFILCDGGCHSGQNNNTGNVVVIDHGHVIDWIG